MDKELLSKAKSAKSAEELVSLAAERNITLTGDEAKSYYAKLHGSGELADEELDNVAGGGCHDVAQFRLIWARDVKCPKCNHKNIRIMGRIQIDSHTDSMHYLCDDCGHQFIFTSSNYEE